MAATNVIETCPTCGTPVTVIAGVEGTHAYTQVDKSDLLERFNAMVSVVSGIRETINSTVLLPNQKLELILSDAQRAVIGIASVKDGMFIQSKEKKKASTNICEDCGKSGKTRYHKKKKMGLFCDHCWVTMTTDPKFR